MVKGLKKMKPILFSTEMVKAILDGRKTQTRRVINPQPLHNIDEPLFNCGYGFVSTAQNYYSNRRSKQEVIYPKYQINSILWVRETWLKADDGYYYRADESVLSKELRTAYGFKWKPSIFMPREAARIFLKVINVRVERVQDISADDCFAEGMAGEYDGSSLCPELREFRELWDKINAIRGYGWKDNPWVWVYEFEQIESPK